MIGNSPATRTEAARVHLSPERVLRVLFYTIGVLVLLSTAGQVSTYYLGFGSVFGLVNLFSLDREANLPTWYASLTLLACAALLGIIAAAIRRETAGEWKYWAGLAAVFLTLSMDEAASVHELSIEPLQAMLGTGGLLHWAWVVPGMAFVLVLGMIYLRFIFALPHATRRLFILAAILFVGGALGVEMLGGWWFGEHGRRNMGYSLFWTVEETLEMVGVAVFIYALLDYIRHHVGPVTVTAGEERNAVPA